MPKPICSTRCWANLAQRGRGPAQICIPRWKTQSYKLVQIQTREIWPRKSLKRSKGKQWGNWIQLHAGSLESKGYLMILFQFFPPPQKKKWVNAFTISVWPCVWAQSLSLVRLFTTQWTIACQAPLSMGFPRQEYWSGWPFPSPEHLPDPEIEPVYPVLAGGFYTTEPPGKPSSLALNFPKLSESPVSQQYGTHEGKFYSLLIWGQAWNSKHIQNQKHIFLKLYLQMNAIKEIYLWRVS